jgi:hypothetical protein
MSGAIPPLPDTFSWRGARLKHRDNFTFFQPHDSICPVVSLMLVQVFFRQVDIQAVRAIITG